jgi:hypothetical protein
MYRNRNDGFNLAVFAGIAALVLIIFFGLANVADAQTDEPDVTAEPTLAVEATAEPDVQIEPDGTVNVNTDSGYEEAFKWMIALLIFLISVGGVTLAIRIFKTPQQAKAAVNTGFDIAEFMAKFTVTRTDDEKIAEARREFNARIDAILLNQSQALTPLLSQAVGAPLGITQMSVKEQVANLEAQLHVLKSYLEDSEVGDVVGGTPD